MYLQGKSEHGRAVFQDLVLLLQWILSMLDLYHCKDVALLF
jgi:hypothetical protein